MVDAVDVDKFKDKLNDAKNFLCLREVNDAMSKVSDSITSIGTGSFAQNLIKKVKA